MKEFICNDCGEPCDAEHEKIDCSGSHCTHGNDGTWTSGYYVSDCCGANYGDNDGEENEQ